jgi:hypothetical protein
LLGAAQVIQNLSPIGDTLPKNLEQTRPRMLDVPLVVQRACASSVEILRLRSYFNVISRNNHHQEVGKAGTERQPLALQLALMVFLD